MIAFRLAVVLAAAAAPAAIDVALHGSLALAPEAAASVSAARRSASDVTGAWSLPALAGGPLQTETPTPKIRRPSFQRIVIDPAGLSRFEGTGSAGMRVVLQDGDRKLGEAVANTAGVWQVTLNEALRSGDHKITALVSDAAGAKSGGEEVRISIPSNTGSDVIVAFDAVRDTPVIIPDAETAADDVRRRAEELGRAATKEFDERVRDLDRARIADAARRDQQRTDRPQATGSDGTIFDPIVNWMDQSTREYQRVIIPKLATGGTAEPPPETVQDRPRDAETPATDVKIAVGGSLIESMRDWLARANRGYQNDVMRKLETGGTPSPTEPQKAESSDDQARRLSEERRAEEDAVRKAEEAQRLDEQQRQAAEKARVESERKAAEAKAAKQREDQQRAERQRQQEEARKAAEAKRAEEEVRRKAEEEKRLAVEAERRKQAEAAAATPPTDESYRAAIRAEEARIAEEVSREERRLPQSRAPAPSEAIAEGSSTQGPVDTAEATEPPRQSRAESAEAAREDVRPRRRLLRPVRRSPSRHQSCRRAGIVIDPPGTYVVKRGDTLWHIADAHYDNPFRYRTIFRANRRRIADPDLIYPCQRFYIPDIKR